MGFVTHLVDLILLLFFLTIAVAAPLIDSQTILPKTLFPTALIDLKKWYSDTYGDYLVKDKPSFFVGLVWIELLLQWPMAVLGVFGILGRKPWLPTTCLIYGVSTFTSMVAILAELTGSQRASDGLLMMYTPFLGAAVLAILRGLFINSGEHTTAGSRQAMSRKKRA